MRLVRNEEELCRSRHLAHKTAEALGVRVIQRRVNLIEQAERCRVQLEQREHERRRGQRLSPPDSRWIDALRLPGGCADDSWIPASRISSPVSTSLRVTTAEQRREQAAELLADLVVGVLQLRAGFAVDATDRVFQRLHRLRPDRLVCASR